MIELPFMSRLPRLFLISYFFLWLVAAVFQLLYRQGIIILWVNQHNNALLDLFFKYATHLGDGRFCVAAGLLALCWSYQKSILILLSYAVSGLLSQILKHFFEEPRPAAYFDGMMNNIHTIPGVELLTSHSFPSGHTTSAFALYTLFAIWTRKSPLSFLWLIPAALAAYSRMYLFQHFLIDVFVGSMLGIITSITVYHLLESYCQKNPKNWHQKRLRL